MPAVFKDIIGHEATKEYLSRILREKSLSHAYCFSGPQAVGKSTLAMAFAAEVLGVSGAEIANHPDITLVKSEIDEDTGETKATISVENIRALTQRLSMTSLCSGIKVAIILEADTMTVAAQNALLKTLEEPRGDTLIILTAVNVNAMLPTIISRVVHLRLTTVPKQAIAKLLQDRGFDQAKALSASGACLGRPGVAIRLLDENEQARAQEAVIEGLEFLKDSLPVRLGFIESYLKTKPTRESVGETLRLWRLLLHDLLLTSSGASSIVALRDQEDQMNKLSGTPKKWSQALRAIDEAQEAVKQNGNLALALERIALAV